MGQPFQSFINEIVIPENWKILSERFDMSIQTAHLQRMKIIGEIVEFHEALELNKSVPTHLGFQDVIDELADIVISTCTLLKILDQSYRAFPENYSQLPEEWIFLVCNQRFSKLITNIFQYAECTSVDIESAVKHKIEYNRTRKDW